MQGSGWADVDICQRLVGMDAGFSQSAGPPPSPRDAGLTGAGMLLGFS
jgi:hypothetical protein